MTNWNRYIELQVGNILIKSDQLDIEFSVKGSSATSANTAEITIYNLSQETRGAIKSDQDVSLRAGYVGDAGDLFIGYVKAVTEQRDQGDLKTKITALTKAYAAGLPTEVYPDKFELKSIVEAAFNASKITAQNVDGCQGVVLDGAHTSDQSAAANLEYCKNLIDGNPDKKLKKVTYYVEANGGYFVTVDHIRGSEKVILSSETGLIETLPEEPNESQYTRSIRCGLNYRIGTDSLIELQSRIPGASGSYKVVEYTHKCEGTDYETEIKVRSP